MICRGQKKCTRQKASLPSAKTKALGKIHLCRVPEKNTRQRRILPCVFVCRVYFIWHSANTVFAECPIKYTRQSLGTRQITGFRQCLVRSDSINKTYSRLNLYCACYISSFHPQNNRSDTFFGSSHSSIVEKDTKTSCPIKKLNSFYTFNLLGKHHFNYQFYLKLLYINTILVIIEK